VVFTHLRKVTLPEVLAEEAQDALDFADTQHLLESLVYGARVGTRAQYAGSTLK